MADRPASASSRPAVLLVLAVLALFCVILASYLRGKAAKASAAAEAARQTLAGDRDLAERYRSASSEKLAISENLAEAQSSEFIPATLRASSIGWERIDYGEGQEGSARFDKVKTTIETKPAPLKSLVDFLRDVEKDRPQLTLLDAKLTREGNADRWSCRLTYGALIPAKSGS